MWAWHFALRIKSRQLLRKLITRCTVQKRWRHQSTKLRPTKLAVFIRTYNATQKKTHLHACTCQNLSDVICMQKKKTCIVSIFFTAAFPHFVHFLACKAEATPSCMHPRTLDVRKAKEGKKKRKRLAHKIRYNILWPGIYSREQWRRHTFCEFGFMCNITRCLKLRVISSSVGCLSSQV
jgi:hypothetical protein